MTDPQEEMVDLCSDEMVELGMLLLLLCSATICEMMLDILSCFLIDVSDSLSFCLAARLTEEVGVPRGRDAGGEDRASCSQSSESSSKLQFCAILEWCFSPYVPEYPFGELKSVIE